MKSIGILRKVCGVDQTLLAERAGLSRQSVNDYERGETFPLRAQAKRLDDAMAAILEERVFAAIGDLPKPTEKLDPPPDTPAVEKEDQGTAG
jgi:transcriptional regulator with XRE-family HTH domain